MRTKLNKRVLVATVEVKGNTVDLYDSNGRAYIKGVKSFYPMRVRGTYSYRVTVHLNRYDYSGVAVKIGSVWVLNAKRVHNPAHDHKLYRMSNYNRIRNARGYKFSQKSEYQLEKLGRDKIANIASISQWK